MNRVRYQLPPMEQGYQTVLVSAISALLVGAMLAVASRSLIVFGIALILVACSAPFAIRLYRKETDAYYERTSLFQEMERHYLVQEESLKWIEDHDLQCIVHHISTKGRWPEWPDIYVEFTDKSDEALFLLSMKKQRGDFIP